MIGHIISEYSEYNVLDRGREARPMSNHNRGAGNYYNYYHSNKPENSEFILVQTVYFKLLQLNLIWILPRIVIAQSRSDILAKLA